MDLPKILLTGLVFLLFLVFLEFLGTKKTKKPILNGLTQDSSHRIGLFFFSFFWFSSSFWTVGLGTAKTSRKTKKNKKTILNGLTQDSSHRIGFFGFSGFFGFPRVFGQLGLGQQKPWEKPNKPKKTNPEWTYPRFFSQDWFFLFFLFFFVFLEFLDSWAWDSKNLEKKQINQKKQSWMDLLKILLTGLVFLVFWFFLVFLEFLDSWAWDSKNLEKNQINQKNKKMDLPKILLTGLFFFGFFWFSSSFWTMGLGRPKNLEKNDENQKKQKETIWKKGKKHEKTKDAKTQRSQRPFLYLYRWPHYPGSYQRDSFPNFGVLDSPVWSDPTLPQNPGGICQFDRPRPPGTIIRSGSWSLRRN